jgi:hypothetical protein
MKMSARDWARIHVFWINRFNWNGKPLLPAEWFDTYIEPGVPYDMPNLWEGHS